MNKRTIELFKDIGDMARDMRDITYDMMNGETSISKATKQINDYLEGIQDAIKQIKRIK